MYQRHRHNANRLRNSVYPIHQWRAHRHSCYTNHWNIFKTYSPICTIAKFDQYESCYLLNQKENTFGFSFPWRWSDWKIVGSWSSENPIPIIPLDSRWTLILTISKIMNSWCDMYIVKKIALTLKWIIYVIMYIQNTSIDVRETDFTTNSFYLYSQMSQCFFKFYLNLHRIPLTQNVLYKTMIIIIIRV